MCSFWYQRKRLTRGTDGKPTTGSEERLRSGHTLAACSSVSSVWMRAAEVAWGTGKCTQFVPTEQSRKKEGHDDQNPFREKEKNTRKFTLAACSSFSNA